MKKIYAFVLVVVLASSAFITGCKKDTKIDIEEPIDYLSIKKGPWNGLDSLTDTIFRTYGVRVFYEFNPRIIDPTTFYVPAQYEKAKLYSKYVVEKMWLEPLKKNFPKFWNDQKPIEFLILGTYVHFNSITSGLAAGAGLNGQFYRLGMGGADGLSFTKATLREHMCTLYHEHAHQLDQKYGRGYAYDRVSQGSYYQLNYLFKPNGVRRTDNEAQIDGFFTPYGGFAPEEDFATSVEFMVRYSKAQIQTIVAKNPKLATKYQMVYKFYLDKGIDLHEMSDRLNQVANTLPF
jgi:substrate import-associated zinc metallohydrolase lipoprotein